MLFLPSWVQARSVVAGRLVNCYTGSDWLLALLYRSKSYDLSIAGLAPISLRSSSSKIQKGDSEATAFEREDAARWLGSANDVENVDVSHIVSSHSDYPKALAKIFEIIRL